MSSQWVFISVVRLLLLCYSLHLLLLLGGVVAVVVLLGGLLVVVVSSRELPKTGGKGVLYFARACHLCQHLRNSQPNSIWEGGVSMIRSSKDCLIASSDTLVLYL